jgi:hypothetical protein
MLSLHQIHELEVEEDYPAAIDALEERLAAAPNDREVLIRLGFNLWYAVVEADRMAKRLPVGRYAARFMALFREHEPRLGDDADFCWAYGLGLSMFWYEFPGATEELGDAMLARAKELDPFYENLLCEGSQEATAERFRGRGILASYYGAVDADSHDGLAE